MPRIIVGQAEVGIVGQALRLPWLVSGRRALAPAHAKRKRLPWQAGRGRRGACPTKPTTASPTITPCAGLSPEGWRTVAGGNAPGTRPLKKTRAPRQGCWTIRLRHLLRGASIPEDSVPGMLSPATVRQPSGLAPAHVKRIPHHGKRSACPTKPTSVCPTRPTTACPTMLRCNAEN
jgi:hypothetical protein